MSLLNWKTNNQTGEVDVDYGDVPCGRVCPRVMLNGTCECDGYGLKVFKESKCRVDEWKERVRSRGRRG